jgi:integrase/recombinase XerD
MIEGYLKAIAVRGSRPKTILTYASGLRSFSAFLTERGIPHLRDVGPEDLLGYQTALQRRELTPASQDLYLRTVRGFLTWLEATHRIFASPAPGLSKVRGVSPLQPVPTEADILRLLAQPDTATPLGIRDRALLETAYSTGARREELAVLRVQDINLAEDTLRIRGKGGRERMVPLGRPACHWLKRYLTEIRPKLTGDATLHALWLGGRGKALGYGGLREVICRYASRATLAVPVTPHSFRRACATHMLQRGAHPAQIQQLLGHVNLQSLDRYLRLAIVDLKNAHANSAPGQ